MSLVFSDLHLLEFRPGVVQQAEFEFCIQTCQRTIAIALEPISHPLARQSLQGAAAYQFFLRFACGLESQIQGETDVFGQVKIAFRKIQETKPELARKFKGYFSSWLEDTKEIRSNFLQGIGGNNYGALARRLLNPQVQDSVVILGAGLLSKTVAPYFSEFDLKVWNRNPERLFELAQQLSRKGNTFEALQTDAALIRALQGATIVILATPADAQLSHEVQAAIPASARVLHLGGERDQLTAVSIFNATVLSLTDLFELDREQSQIRRRQVSEALIACQQRTRLRSLARSIHIAHGWEDLALFY